MKKTFRALSMASLVLFGAYQAQAGVGLSAYAIGSICSGNILSAAVTGGLGMGAIATSLNRFSSGHWGWGTFFLVLEEKDVHLNEADKEILESQDVSLIHTIAAVADDKNMSEEEKREVLSEILGE